MATKHLYAHLVWSIYQWDSSQRALLDVVILALVGCQTLWHFAIAEPDLKRIEFDSVVLKGATVK
jgi:hypothetical protein